MMKISLELFLEKIVLSCYLAFIYLLVHTPVLLCLKAWYNSQKADSGE